MNAKRALSLILTVILLFSPVSGIFLPVVKVQAAPYGNLIVLTSSETGSIDDAAGTVSQSFQLSTLTYFLMCSFYVRNNGATSYLTSLRTCASNDTPTGSDIVSNTTSYNMGGSWGWLNFTFPQTDLAANTKYCVIINASLVHIQYATGSPYLLGGAAVWTGSSWGNLGIGWDFNFRVYGYLDDGLSSPSQSVNTTTPGAAANFTALWQVPASNVSGYIFGSNNTGPWTNQTWTDSWISCPTSYSAWASVVTTLNNTLGATIQYEWWCNDTNNNWVDAGLHSIILYSILVNDSMAIRFQQKTFYANGRYWLFYVDSAINPSVSTPGIPFFTSSTDNQTWQTPTQISCPGGMFEPTGENLEVLCNNGYVDFFLRARNAGGQNDVWYNRGSPNSDGTVTWIGTWTTIINNDTIACAYDFYAIMDTNGHLWMSWIAGKNVYLVENANTNGSWTTASGFPLEAVSTASNTNNFLVSLPSGQFYLFYYYSSLGSPGIKGMLWNGTAFENEENVSSDYPYPDYPQGQESYARSVVSDGSGNIYLLFLNQNQNLVFYERNATGWSQEQTVQSSCANYASPSLTLYQGTLHAIWVNDSHTILSKLYEGTSWSNSGILASTVWSIPTFNLGGYERLNAFSQVFGNDLGIVWLENTTISSVYSIRFYVFYNPLPYLAINGSTASKTRMNPSVVFIVSGTVIYNGTNMVPSQGIATIYVALSATVKNSTTSYNSSGNFNFSVTSQPTVGSWSYTVYATSSLGVSVVNQTVTVITDELNITLHADSLDPASGTQVNMTATATYAYDGTTVSTLGVTIGRNGLFYSSSTSWTDNETAATTYVFSVLAANDTTYGLSAWASNQLTVAWGQAVVEISQIVQNTTRTGINQNAGLSYHLIWASNSSDVASGTLTVNGTVYTVSSGWANFTATFGSVANVVFVASAVNVGSSVVLSQVPADPHIIFDQVLAFMSTSSASPVLGTGVTISWSLIRSWDGTYVTNFNGTVLRDGSVWLSNVSYYSSSDNSFSAPLTHTYSFGSILDNTYGISALYSDSVQVTWSMSGYTGPTVPGQNQNSGSFRVDGASITVEAGTRTTCTIKITLNQGVWGGLVVSVQVSGVYSSWFSLNSTLPKDILIVDGVDQTTVLLNIWVPANTSPGQYSSEVVVTVQSGASTIVSKAYIYVTVPGIQWTLSPLQTYMALAFILAAVVAGVWGFVVRPVRKHRRGY